MTGQNFLSLTFLMATVIAACATPPSASEPSEPTLLSTTSLTPAPIDVLEQQPSTDATTPGQEPPELSHGNVRSLPEFASPDGVYSITSIVIEDSGSAPVVCVGPVLASNPPHCGGLVLIGFSWSDVAFEDYGEIRVSEGVYLEGTFEGGALVVSSVRPSTESDRPLNHSYDFSSPCEIPAGGWAIVDQSLVSDDDFSNAAEYANTIDDRSAVWATQPPIEVPDPIDMILNVAVVANVELHEAQLRARWGGPLCVFQRDGRAADLRAIQDDISGDPAELGAVIVSTNEINKVVEVTVIVADPGTIAYFAERWDPDVVQVSGYFQPVDDQ